MRNLALTQAHEDGYTEGERAAVGGLVGNVAEEGVVEGQGWVVGYTRDNPDVHLTDRDWLKLLYCFVLGYLDGVASVRD